MTRKPCRTNRFILATRTSFVLRHSLTCFETIIKHPISRIVRYFQTCVDKTYSHDCPTLGTLLSCIYRISCISCIVISPKKATNQTIILSVSRYVWFTDMIQGTKSRVLGIDADVWDCNAISYKRHPQMFVC